MAIEQSKDKRDNTAALVNELSGPWQRSADAMSSLAGQIEQLRVAQAEQNLRVAENSQALLASTTSRTAEGGGVVREVVQGATSRGLGGLLLGPLAGGLLKLFGGGGKREEPALLPAYGAPQRQNIAAALSAGGSVGELGYDASGMPRRVGAPMVGASGSSSVVVNIQAMDSRSFLDHSEEISRAVREAMLNSGALQDVIAEYQG
jgi:hypothetical protein